MTFKHRLSRRLAVLRPGLALLLAVGLSACAAEDQMPLGPQDPSAPPEDDLTFEVLPPSMVLEIGQEARFLGLDLSTAGDTVAAPVEWSVSGGTISTDGLFSAARAGVFRIIGRHRFRNKGGNTADTSVVTVVPPAPDLEEIIISPASADLLTGATLSFSAVGRLSDSSRTQIAVTWSATGGQIDGNGSYRAGNTAGQYRVVATNTARTIADTVTVDISRPAPTLARVILTPATASVVVGGTVQLSTYGRNSDGDSVAVTPTYAATGGTVTSAGLFTAGSTAGSYRAIASSGGFADTSSITVTAAPPPPPPPPPAVTRIVLTPATASLAPGGKQTFFAYGRTASGDSVTATVAYTATGGTMSGAQYTAGSTAGAFRVIATSGAMADTSAVTITAAPPPPPPSGGTRVGYHVQTNGSPSGDGSASRPWDLASVVAGSRGVRAGDTVWVHGGTYRTGELVSYVAGSSAGQVVIRQYPGERAVVDGNLVIQGGYVSYWGLEVMSSNPVGSGKMGINVRAPNVKLINLVVHDAGMSGIGHWMESPNSEVYGSIIYNNGTHANLDHGMYVQNSSGTKTLRDNIVFNNLAYGFHLYTSDGQYNRNVTLEGNVSFNNGTIGNDAWRPDYLVGGSTPASGIVARGNYSFRTDRRETGDWGWYYGAINQDLTLVDNYFVGTLHVDRWQTVNQSNNTVVPTTASGTKVFVRPNLYEAGRATVVVYNWARQGSVSADLGGIMAPGTAYEVRSVQQFTGSPVSQGTYSGGSISIPMGSVSAPTPIGRSTRAAPTTGLDFDVFVVLPKP